MNGAGLAVLVGLIFCLSRRWQRRLSRWLIVIVAGAALISLLGRTP